MKLYFLNLLVIFFSLSAFAGGGGVDVDGGGHGVQGDSEMYLLDFVESGRVDRKLDVSKERLPVAGDFLELMPKDTAFILKQVMYRIWKTDKVLAVAVVQALDFLQWSFVDGTLNPLPVEDTPLQKSVFQVASRKAQTVYINRWGWEQMPAVDQAGLVIHEVLSALADEKLPAVRVRELVGALFSHAPLPQGIQQSLQEYWPGIAKAQREIKAKWGHEILSGSVANLVKIENPNLEILDLRSSYSTALLFPSFTLKTLDEKNEFSVLAKDFLWTKETLVEHCQNWIQSHDRLFVDYRAYLIELSLPELREKNLPHLQVSYRPSLWHFSKISRSVGCKASLAPLLPALEILVQDGKR